MNTCQIQWIGADGKATPDSNPAIGRVMLPARVLQISGRGVKFEATSWYFICACHARELSKPGMKHWIFEAIES